MHYGNPWRVALFCGVVTTAVIAVGQEATDRKADEDAIRAAAIAILRVTKVSPRRGDS